LVVEKSNTARREICS